MWTAWGTFYTALPVAGAAGAATPKQSAVNTDKDETDPTILSAAMLESVCNGMFLNNSGSKLEEVIRIKNNVVMGGGAGGGAGQVQPGKTIVLVSTINNHHSKLGFQLLETEVLEKARILLVNKQIEKEYVTGDPREQQTERVDRDLNVLYSAIKDKLSKSMKDVRRTVPERSRNFQISRAFRDSSSLSLRTSSHTKHPHPSLPLLTHPKNP